MSKGIIYVRNTDSNDLFVTIVDRNAAPGTPALWTDERLNEDETKPLKCEIDGTGYAYLEWEAQDAGDPTSKSSSTEKVAEGGELEVYA